MFMIVVGDTRVPLLHLLCASNLLRSCGLQQRPCDGGPNGCPLRFTPPHLLGAPSSAAPQFKTELPLQGESMTY
jgi:hypothetical protein